MANRQKLQQFGFVLAFFGAATLHAQSLSDVEKSLLLDDASSSSADSQTMPEEAPERPARKSRKGLDSQSSTETSYQAPADDVSAGDLLQEAASQDNSSAADYVYGSQDRKEVEASALEKIDEAISGPKQIPFEHVLVVKNRYVNKAGRFELAPITVSLQPADSFRKQLGVGFSLAYHFTEDLGFEFLHASFTTNYRTSLESDLNNDSKILQKMGFSRVEPVISLGSALWWAPFKGKSATIENIYHWEAYFLGGGGVTRTEAAFVGMGMFGAGARFYLNKRALLRLEIRDYYDFTTNGDHRVNILAGAGVLFGDD